MEITEPNLEIVLKNNSDINLKDKNSSNSNDFDDVQINNNKINVNVNVGLEVKESSVNSSFDEECTENELVDKKNEDMNI